jgi:hypothetical protein
VWWQEKLCFATKWHVTASCCLQITSEANNFAFQLTRAVTALQESRPSPSLVMVTLGIEADKLVPFTDNVFYLSNRYHRITFVCSYRRYPDLSRYPPASLRRSIEAIPSFHRNTTEWRPNLLIG